MSHVFLSYCHEDADFAEILRDQLSRAGLATWKDADLRAGTHWADEIEDAIKEAIAVVVVQSPSAQTSEYVSFEWAYAQGAGIPVVPVLLKVSPEKLHPRLRDLQALDFSNYVSRPWDSLTSRLLEINSAERKFTISVPRDAPPVLRQAVQAMDSLNARERIIAVEALGEMNDPAVVEVLARALKHPLGDVRAAAVIALTKKGDLRAIEGYFAAVREGNVDQLNASEIKLSSLGPAAAAQLIKAATDAQENESVRIRSLNALASIKPPEGLPTILRCLEDSNPKIRVACLRLLKGNDAVREALISKLRDPDNSVASVALQAVEGLRGADLVLPLVEMLKHPSQGTRCEAAKRLEVLGDPTAIPALIDALQDEDSTVRSFVSGALRKLGNETALPELLKALAHSPPNIKPQIISLLGEIGGEGAVSPLIEYLQSDIAPCRAYAAYALRNLHAMAATPQLLKALDDRNQDVRRAAAAAIEELKPDGAVPALKAILDDDLEEDESVLRYIIGALKAIGTREARLAARDWERTHKNSTHPSS